MMVLYTQQAIYTRKNKSRFTQDASYLGHEYTHI